MPPVDHGNTGRSAAEATSPLGKSPVRCVVDASSESRQQAGVCFDPDDKIGAGFAELIVADTGCSGRTANRGIGIMIGKGDHIAAFGGEGRVGTARTIVDSNVSADRLDVSLRSGRADLAARGVSCREFLRVLAVDESGLFVS